jgi:hypothetical protein
MPCTPAAEVGRAHGYRRLPKRTDLIEFWTVLGQTKHTFVIRGVIMVVLDP